MAHATFRFIKLTEKRTGMSSLESFALMIASICHDMDHPGKLRVISLSLAIDVTGRRVSGLQNAFLVDTHHHLAAMYNDRSVLENRHVSCVYALVSQHPEADVFQYLDKSSWKDVRKIIIESILHTDMGKHFGMVSKVEIFYELHGAAINADNGDSLFDDPGDRLFLFSLILHCADISNPVRPLNIAEK